MTKQQIQKEWRKLIFETIHNKPKIDTPYPLEVSEMRGLLLFAQVELVKVKDGKDKNFHLDLYKTILKHYFKWKKCLKI